MSHAYMPDQQNGSAERKWRHIVDVGLSLSAHASMPLNFWNQAFLAATYLIYRSPSVGVKTGGSRVGDPELCV